MAYNMATIIKFVLTQLLVFGAVLFVHADMSAPSLESLIDSSDMILLGEVTTVGDKSMSDSGIINQTAYIMKIDVLMGKTKDSQILVNFSYEEGAKSVSPIKLHENYKYLFFLRESGSSYELSDKYFGAVEESKLSDVNLELLRVLIEKDQQQELAFEKITLTARLDKNEFSLGEQPTLELTVSNQSELDIEISCEVLNDNNQYVMKGQTYLIFDKIRSDGSVVSNNLGGASYGDKKSVMIKAGEVKIWSSQFNWGDYCQKTGLYRLTWFFGKKKSNSVTYRILEKGEESTSVVEPETFKSSVMKTKNPNVYEKSDNAGQNRSQKWLWFSGLFTIVLAGIFVIFKRKKQRQ